MSFGFGLIGEKLAHSYSPAIHNALGAYQYGLYEVSPKALEDFMKNEPFSGLNVTSPYKKEVMKYVTADPLAKRLGNVNTIYYKDGRLRGTNTDYFGFMYLLSYNQINLEGKKILILGTGGASATVQNIAKLCSASKIFVASREKSKDYVSYNNLPKDVQIIVNATPVGSYPKTEQCLLDLEAFDNLEAVIDLIYNPAKTRLLLQAEEKGIKIANGLSMLTAQALKSAEYFTGIDYRSYINPMIENLKKATTNIIIIGMPGCGKTTVGKAVADAASREFFDVDDEIIALAGKDIPTIFKDDGEKAFRLLETQVLKKLCSQRGIVIATGGGSILSKENRDIIRSNAFVAEIKRDFSLLETAGRPLFLNTSPEEMYKERKQFYDAAKDFSVTNDQAPETTADRILNAIRRIKK